MAIDIVHTDITFGEFRRICSAYDVQLVVQLLRDDLRCILLAIIAGILHAIIEGCHLTFNCAILVNDTCNAIRTIDAFGTLFTTLAIITILNRDIDGLTIFTICTFRSSQTNVTDTVFTTNGNSILAVCTSNADLAVDTVLSVSAFRTIRPSNRYASSAIFTIFALDGNTIFTIDDNRLTIGAVQANLTIDTIFST